MKLFSFTIVFFDFILFRYTCSAWSPVPSQIAGQSGLSAVQQLRLAKEKEKEKDKEKERLKNEPPKSQIAKDSALGYFAVGTTSGTVVIFDLERGIVRTTIKITDPTSSSSDVPVINDIIFSNDAKSIYVATNSSTIQKIDWSTGSVESTRKAGKKDVIKLDRNPKLDGTVLCVSTALRVVSFDCEDDKLKIDVAGYIGGISATSFSSCGRFIACCGASNDSDSNNNSKNKNNSNNVSSNTKDNKLVIFSLDSGADDSAPIAQVSIGASEVKSISFRSFSSRASPNYTLLSVFLIMQDGTSCVVKLGHESNSVNEQQAAIPQILKLPESVNVLSATFGTHGSPKLHSSVTIAIGVDTKPKFHEIDIGQGADGSSGNNISNGSSSQIITYLEIPGLSIKRSVESTKPQPDDAVDSSDGKRAKTAVEKSGAQVDIMADTNINAQTIGQLLNLLSAPGAGNETNGSASGTEVGLVGVKGSRSNDLGAPTSDSLVTLIVQALQSGDNSLLEQCLSCEDTHVIEESSKRLPTARVVVFLKRLVAKFEKRPSRGILLTKWLSSLLRYHTAFLISIPDLAKHLGGLSQMLEQRQSTYHRLSALSGRLDFLLSNSALSSEASAISDVGTQNSMIPLKIYVEE
jgi:U3 small nucleolar RNA-associated protein 5